MRTWSSAFLLTLVIGVLFLVSCSNNAPTEPAVSPDREIGGSFSPADPDPWWDCQRFFIVDYEITYGDGIYSWLTRGSIRIRDEDCSKNNAEIRARFVFRNNPYWTEELPGRKRTTSAGRIYWGGDETEWGDNNRGYTLTREYEILTHQPEDGPHITAIDGWYNRHMHYWWKNNGGKKEHWHYDWHAVIDGREIFIAPEPDPRP